MGMWHGQGCEEVECVEVVDGLVGGWVQVMWWHARAPIGP